MAIIGLFTQSRPSIDGLYFDAVLEESSELLTEVTEFPIEDGSIGNDHAVQRPLTLTMRVGVSDNRFRALREQAGDVGGALAGSALGALSGFALSKLGADAAIAAGLAASLANAAYAAGQAQTRSESVLEEIRLKQRANALVTVIASGRQYENMMITGTRREKNKENEQALELVIEMRQLLTVKSVSNQDPVPAPNDPAETQAQPEIDLGQVLMQ